MRERLRRSSLWARGLIGAALGVVLAVVLSGVVIWGLFTTAVERQFDSQFEDYLKAMTAAVGGGPRYSQSFSNHLGVGLARAREDRPGGDQNRLSFDPRFGRAYGGIYWEARRVVAHDDAEQDLVFRSVSLWDFPLPRPSPEPELGETRRVGGLLGPLGAALRVVERRVRVERTGDEWILLVAAEETTLAQSRDAFAPYLAFSLSVLAAALVAAAAFQVRFMLGPFGSFRRSIAEYRAGRSTRIEGVYPAEVAPLVEDLNGLLDRNERLIAQGRRRAADLAHEMKTPVAVLRNELEALAEKRASAAAGAGEAEAWPSEDFEAAFEALAQIERQTRRQLARARVGAMQGARTPLRPAAERLRRTLQRLQRAPMTIRLDLPPGLVFRGDEEDLEELLGELMHNAVRWARGEVRVTAEAVENGLLRLMVEDDGPGVAPENHARMLAPGGRLDSRRPGSGIGLTMVADLVEAYGGELSLGRAETGGLRVSLLLPGERAP